MHIELDTTGSKLSYVAGDHVAIYPVNDPQQVERVGELLSVDLDTVFTLANVDSEATKPHPFPCPTSYRTALSHYVDISAPPRTHVLRELSEFASDPKEREFLLDITSPSVEGKVSVGMASTEVMMWALATEVGVVVWVWSVLIIMILLYCWWSKTFIGKF